MVMSTGMSVAAPSSFVVPADPDWIRARLARGRLVPPLPGDPEPHEHPPDFAAVDAAVLVPLVNRPGGLTVLLTQRTAHLHHHAGQVSFPGGRVDPGDRDRVDTALRETAEEIGIARDHVRILGTLQHYDILTGFRVTPIVGWLEPGFRVQPDPFEVADVFEVPLAFFHDRANWVRASGERDGRTRHFWRTPWEGRNIWGATSGMLHTLTRTLASD
ncbi:MAG: CoA pyrophosphatase [Burkholderiales bacterium]|nr:CoA pyrophosphatase [Burkholderiales bacterium]